MIVLVEHLDAPSRRVSMRGQLLSKQEFVCNLGISRPAFHKQYLRIFLGCRPCSSQHDRRPALTYAVLRRLCALHAIEVAQQNHAVLFPKSDTMASAHHSLFLCMQYLLPHFHQLTRADECSLVGFSLEFATICPQPSQTTPIIPRTCSPGKRPIRLALPC